MKTMSEPVLRRIIWSSQFLPSTWHNVFFTAVYTHTVYSCVALWQIDGMLRSLDLLHCGPCHWTWIMNHYITRVILADVLPLSWLVLHFGYLLPETQPRLSTRSRGIFLRDSQSIMHGSYATGLTHFYLLKLASCRHGNLAGLSINTDNTDTVALTWLKFLAVPFYNLHTAWQWIW